MWDDEAGYDYDDPKHPDYEDALLGWVDQVRKAERENVPSGLQPPDDDEHRCEHKWRDYSEYGGDFEKTPIVCRDCGVPAPPEIVAAMTGKSGEGS